jgi:hypothetical protein
LRINLGQVMIAGFVKKKYLHKLAREVYTMFTPACAWGGRCG